MPQINALGQLHNHFLPTHKLEKKVHCQGRITRVLAAAQLGIKKKAASKALHARLNPFPLPRELERQKKEIEALRQLGVLNADPP